MYHLFRAERNEERSLRRMQSKRLLQTRPHLHLRAGASVDYANALLRAYGKILPMIFLTTPNPIRLSPFERRSRPILKS